MFDDKRSKRILLVAHCVLNQNAKLDRCAHYPGAITELTNLLIKKGFGIIQLPCPELILFGLDRKTDSSLKPSIMEEDTRISKLLREEEYQATLIRMVDDIIYQIEEYQKNGFRITGLIGINGSPTCGIETNWADDKEPDGYGVFIDILAQKLVRKGIELTMTGIKAGEPKAAYKKIKTAVLQSKTTVSH